MKRRMWRHGMFYAVALGSLLATTLVASSAGAATGAPSAPRAVRASGTATTISVKWTRPAVVGADALREYVVTSHPLSRRCVTRATTCKVKGLTVGRDYTFSVVAKNGFGASRPTTSNRVAVAKASTYFVSSLNVFNAAETSAENALGSADTAAAAQKGLERLSGAFRSLIAALNLEQWPAASRSAVAAFVADTRKLDAGTITTFEASTTSATSQDLDAVQSDTNTDVLAESAVFSKLGLTAPVIPSNAATPTPVAVNTAQTVTDLFGDSVSVTATQVVDPATAATTSGVPAAGSRFVAVDLNIAHTSANTIAGDANYSTSVVGSNGTTYQANFDTVSQCASFNDGYFDLPASDVATGCVVFQLPTAVTVQSITFTFAPGYLDSAEWTSS